MTKEEMMHLCDKGYFNDTIRGYLIQAMENAGFSVSDIDKALEGLSWAFDGTTAEEAAQIYRKF